MPELQNQVMRLIYTSTKTSKSGGTVAEFLQIAYKLSDGEIVLAKVAQAVLTWCSPEYLTQYADKIPSKLVVQMMMI